MRPASDHTYPVGALVHAGPLRNLGPTCEDAPVRIPSACTKSFDDVTGSRAEECQVVENMARVSRPVQGSELCPAAAAHSPAKGLKSAGGEHEFTFVVGSDSELCVLHHNAQRHRGSQPAKQPFSAIPDCLSVPVPRAAQGSPNIVFVTGDIDQWGVYLERTDGTFELRRGLGPSGEDMRHTAVGKPGDLRGRLRLGRWTGQAPGNRILGNRR